jgi:predicted Rossmann-fold nucleotide-binding protein
MIERLVSGGQTGVDRAALDVAIACGIPHGGWCPRGRISEAGPIPAHYQLTETDSFKYWVRTERNVIDSDATLILFCDRTRTQCNGTRTRKERDGRTGIRS